MTSQGVLAAHGIEEKATRTSVKLGWVMGEFSLIVISRGFLLQFCREGGCRRRVWVWGEEEEVENTSSSKKKKKRTRGGEEGGGKSSLPLPLSPLLLPSSLFFTTAACRPPEPAQCRNAHFGWAMALNRGTIPRERPPEREREKKERNLRRETEKSAKFWATRPQGPHPSGSSGPLPPPGTLGLAPTVLIFSFFSCAASQTLGPQSNLLDWGWKFHAHVWVDATAGIAIGSRRGLGRVKHIDTVFLWVQTMVTEGKISLGKKPTKGMLADLLTKHVDATTTLNCMSGLVSIG